MKYCKFIRQVKSSVKIVSLIALFILLFSISCKTKFNPSEALSEETYSIIPEEYSGKYSNSLATYETTSSNCIISIWRNIYENKTYTNVIPIVFLHTYTNRRSYWPYNEYSVNTYYDITSDPYYTNFYHFWTNDKSQRQLQIIPNRGADYWNDYIHIDDINK